MVARYPRRIMYVGMASRLQSTDSEIKQFQMNAETQEIHRNDRKSGPMMQTQLPMRDTRH